MISKCLPPESEEFFQYFVVDFLSLALPKEAFFFHIPNGGKRPTREGVKLKKMGVKAGVPDLFIGYRGTAVFLELKVNKGKLSRKQNETIQNLEKAGFPCFVVRNIAELKTALSLVEIPHKQIRFF